MDRSMISTKKLCESDWIWLARTEHGDNAIEPRNTKHILENQGHYSLQRDQCKAPCHQLDGLDLNNGEVMRGTRLDFAEISHPLSDGCVFQAPNRTQGA
jgi:hypothetical protein